MNGSVLNKNQVMFCDILLNQVRIAVGLGEALSAHFGNRYSGTGRAGWL